MYKSHSNSSLAIIQELKYQSKSSKNILSKKDIEKQYYLCHSKSPFVNSITINSYRSKPHSNQFAQREIAQPNKEITSETKPIHLPKLFIPIKQSFQFTKLSYIPKRDANKQIKTNRCLPILLSKTKPINKEEPINEGQSPFHVQPKIKEYEIKSYYSSSSPGGKHHKLQENQDAFIEKTYPNDINHYSYFGVFDGHGKNGSVISQSVALFLEKYFSHPEFIGNSTHAEDIIRELKNNDNGKIKDSYLKAEIMLKNSYIDATLSGTSATILFIINDFIFCSNVGDSRAIAITTSNTVIPLSFDHKPDLTGEADRIKRLSGRIERLKGDNNGPLRIWLKDDDYPGLSMSRSIGDVKAKEIGVINEPEIIQYSFKNIKPKIIICATDGIWELMSNNDIIAIVNPFYSVNDSKGAVNKLIEEAKIKWKTLNNGFVDDITVIVLFF